jgi:hypothetical protein
MGVDATRDLQHGGLCLQPDGPQPAHVGSAPTGPCQLGEERAQHLGVRVQHGRIHVRLAAAVDMADEAGLRRGRKLIEQCVAGAGRRSAPRHGPIPAAGQDGQTVWRMAASRSCVLPRARLRCDVQEPEAVDGLSQHRGTILDPLRMHLRSLFPASPIDGPGGTVRRSTIPEEQKRYQRGSRRAYRRIVNDSSSSIRTGLCRTPASPP